MNYRKFMKNSKAISPIFATLILIAIAVIAGVVVYMFVSGTLATMTGSSTAAQEKVSIQASQYVAGVSPAHYTITMYVESTAGPVPTVNGILIKNTAGNIVDTLGTLEVNGLATPLTLTSGTLVTVTGLGTTVTLPSGTYTATLTTASGGSFVSPSFNV